MYGYPTQHNMELIISLILAAITAYLLGSINFAIVVTKIVAKKDIRDFGSGNAGMTNVLRTLGKGPAAFTFAGDLLKGVIAILLGQIFVYFIAGTKDFMIVNYLTGLMALLGHAFPVFYKFKGGKGILVSAGIILVLNPIVFLITLATFLVFVIPSKIVSLSSIASSIAFPIGTFLVNGLSQKPWGDTIFETVSALIICIIVIIMHRSNIKKLLNGTEYKFGQKKK